jgi:S1-C subfamily serine protease
MSNVHEQPEAQGPAQPGSQSPYAGAGFPVGPGVPPGADWAYPPPPPARRPRRMLTGVVAAGVAFAAGAGVTAWAAGVPGTSIAGALSSPQLSTSAIVSKTDPAVVDIVSNLGDQGAESAGTGIVLTSNGEILTNNHVIDGATAIRVTDVGNGQTYTASVIGYDASHDVAVIKLANASGLKTATIGDSASVSTGDKVVAIGNAGGKGGLPSVATGQVTGLNKAINASDEGSGSTEHLTDMIRTNADIQPGDSGGPLLNTKGQVVGIDTAAQTGTFEASAQAQAEQAFSIPINRALRIASEITSGSETGTVHIGATAFLGVEVTSAGQGGFGSGSTTSGAQVAGVVPGGVAARAGITGGDTIVAVGGKTVASPTSLRDNLISRHPGDKVTITWLTQTGQRQSATVTLGSGPAA